jgi:hypothetical protein
VGVWGVGGGAVSRVDDRVRVLKVSGEPGRHEARRLTRKKLAVACQINVCFIQSKRLLELHDIDTPLTRHRHAIDTSSHRHTHTNVSVQDRCNDGAME